MSWASDLKKSVRDYFTKKKKVTTQPARKDNVRTKQVKSGLSAAGLSDAEIKRLQGKK